MCKQLSSHLKTNNSQKGSLQSPLFSARSITPFCFTWGIPLTLSLYTAFVFMTQRKDYPTRLSCPPSTLPWESLTPSPLLPKDSALVPRAQVSQLFTGGRLRTLQWGKCLFMALSSAPNRVCHLVGAEYMFIHWLNDWCHQSHQTTLKWQCMRTSGASLCLNTQSYVHGPVYIHTCVCHIHTKACWREPLPTTQLPEHCFWVLFLDRTQTN